MARRRLGSAAQARNAVNQAVKKSSESKSSSLRKYRHKRRSRQRASTYSAAEIARVARALARSPSKQQSACKRANACWRQEGRSRYAAGISRAFSNQIYARRRKAAPVEEESSRRKESRQKSSGGKTSMPFTQGRQKACGGDRRRKCAKEKLISMRIVRNGRARTQHGQRQPHHHIKEEAVLARRRA